MAYSQNNIGWNQVNKKVTKATRKIAKTVDEYVMPKSATDVAMLLFPYGKVAKGVGRAVKKVVKPATKVKKIASTAKDEIIMAKAGWNDAAKKNYRADVKRGTYNKTKKVTKTIKKK